jgi:angio-associated migratory cell protein
MAADGAEEEEEEEVQDDSAHSFDGHTDAVFSVAWNPAEQGSVATGGGDDRAFLWRAGTADGTIELGGDRDDDDDVEEEEGGGGAKEADGNGAPKQPPRRHTDSVVSLAFSPDGSLLASGGLDGVVLLWDAETGEAPASLPPLDEGPSDGVEWVCWHPRGRALLAGSEDFLAYLWDTVTGKLLCAPLAGHGGAVRCGAFTPDGRGVVTGGGEGDATLRRWDPRTGCCVASVSGHGYHEAGLTCLAPAPLSAEAAGGVSRTVLTGSEDGTARLAIVEGASDDGVVSATSASRPVTTFSGHEESVEAVCWVLAPNAPPLVASASVDGTLRLWDVATGTERARCEHGAAVSCAAVSPSASGNNAAQGAAAAAPSSSSSSSSSSFSSAPPLIATGCLDGCVRLWDARSGELARVFKGHRGGVQAVAFSPDGRALLSASDDATAKVFEII